MAGNLQAVLARMKWTTTHSGYNYLQAILKSSKESSSKKDFWCMLYSLCQLAYTKEQLPKNRLCAHFRILKNYIFGACTCNELDQNMVFDVRSVHETWTELLQAQAESQSQVCKSLTQPPYNYHQLRSIQKNGYDVCVQENGTKLTKPPKKKCKLQVSLKFWSAWSEAQSGTILTILAWRQGLKNHGFSRLFPETCGFKHLFFNEMKELRRSYIIFVCTYVTCMTKTM